MIELHLKVHIAPNYYVQAHIQTTPKRSIRGVEKQLSDNLRNDKAIFTRATNIDATSSGETSHYVPNST